MKLNKLRNVVATCCLALSMNAVADNHGGKIEELHFLIPGGAGGGWDGTARGTGEALTNAGLVGTASYENMSGGGGGKAIAHLIETAEKAENTLMVNSTPIVIRSLQKVFPQSFRDLTPVAGTIGDYAAIVVAPDSEYKTVKDLNEAIKADPKSVAIAGGSVAGSMDHLVVAMVAKAGGAEATKVKYVAYDAGGEALAGLLTGEAQALSTGLSEVIDKHKSGQVRILCYTAEEKIADLDAETCSGSGAEGANFVNWRGFFGPPGLSEEKQQAYVDMFTKMYETEEWEEVRKRNGWVNIYNPGDKFTEYLEGQEQVIGELMKELGFL